MHRHFEDKDGAPKALPDILSKLSFGSLSDAHAASNPEGHQQLQSLVQAGIPMVGVDAPYS